MKWESPVTALPPIKCKIYNYKYHKVHTAKQRFAPPLIQIDQSRDNSDKLNYPNASRDQQACGVSTDSQAMDKGGTVI